MPEDEELVEIGRSEVVHEGHDLTVVSWGAMMRPTLQAVAELQERRGIAIELIDLLSIRPLDSAPIIASVRKTGRIAVVQEGPRYFSVASEVIARINDDALMYLQAPVKRITGYDVVTPYFNREEHYIPDVARIRRGLEEVLDFA